MSKSQFQALIRISLGLVALWCSQLLLAQWFGLMPNQRDAVMHGRSKLCESIAINCSALLQLRNTDLLKASLQAVAARNPEIESIGLRQVDGQMLFSLGDHARLWEGYDPDQSTETHIHVPLFEGPTPWGTVELRMRSLQTPGWPGWLEHPTIILLLFLSSCGLLSSFLYMRRVLRQLDPARVVPTRVRQALDTLAEGLLVLDHEERIVLANQSIRTTLDCEEDLLLGRRASEIPWVAKSDETKSDDERNDEVSPWKAALEEGQSQRGKLMGLSVGHNSDRTFVVNACPINDEEGVRRGVVASFEDVTPLEKKKSELVQALRNVRTAAEQIREQNRELERLATRDPLTGVFNRRSFYEQFSVQWENARRYGHPLACAMVDIDHFKAVNDEHGHAIGDEVLQRVAAALQTAARQGDVVARYGGEEFVILLTHTDLDGAEHAAEKIRAAIQSLALPNLRVTASLGISSLELRPESMEELLDQADQGLYAAKRLGRNRVIRFDTIPDDLPMDTEGRKPRDHSHDAAAVSVPIPFPAVTALISALAYRDSATAEHSRRVADLCAMMAEGIVSASECYVIEIGALLHDIGKIGVPDNILLKPGSLTPEEWQVMEKHDRIGVEIIRASFSSELLSAIVENHHAFFGGGARHKGLPTGLDIPIGARMLSIADAYDAMVSDRVYREGRPPAEAFEELRRCAGTQFDPELVERFIGLMEDRLSSQQQVGPPAVEGSGPEHRSATGTTRHGSRPDGCRGVKSAGGATAGNGHQGTCAGDCGQSSRTGNGHRSRGGLRHDARAAAGRRTVACLPFDTGFLSSGQPRCRGTQHSRRRSGTRGGVSIRRIGASCQKPKFWASSGPGRA